jgi:hypothetical protein
MTPIDLRPDNFTAARRFPIPNALTRKKSHAKWAESLRLDPQGCLYNQGMGIVLGDMDLL